jgi:hypothetical protein
MEVPDDRDDLAQISLSWRFLIIEIIQPTSPYHGIPDDRDHLATSTYHGGS